MLQQNQQNTMPHPKKVTEQKLSLFNILTCLLCSSKAKVAHICPNCSKFYCLTCIKQWIEQGKQYCPHCKGYINHNNVVNCNKLSQDLSNALQALIQLQTPQQFSCQNHNIAQTYYCLQCKHSICSDCIVLESNHRGHNICKLKKIKMEFNQLILMMLSKIRKNIKEIQKIKQQRNLDKNNQNQQMKNKVDKIKYHMQRVKSNYQQIINQTTQQFQDQYQKNKLSQISGVKIYQQFLQEIKQMSKTSFVRRKQSQLQNILQNSLKQSTQKFITKSDIRNIINTTQINNIISSKYAQKTFILSNYTQCRNKREVIYSDSFYNGQLEWRLKIYPNGLQQKRQSPNTKNKYINLNTNYNTNLSTNNVSQEYISIYIELVSGVREGSRYKFKIQISNPLDQSKSISQIYQADFDTGKCWGYDQFANILTLYQKGYVHPQQDSLKISVSVGTPSYYYSTLDQQAIIYKKQQNIRINQIKIQQLKKQIQIIKNKNITTTFIPDLQSKIKYQIHKLNFNTQSNHNLNHLQNNNNYNQSQSKLTTSQIQQSQSSSDVITPRCKIIQNINQQKNIQRINTLNQQHIFDKSIDFQNYIVEEPIQEMTRCTEEFDHQSAELRKIYRRLANMNQRENLLLF